MSLSGEQIKPIKYDNSNRLPEANVQAELYRRCWNQGIKCILEHRHEGCRFDALILDSNYEAIAIVEVKNARKLRKPLLERKQYQKYSAFGVPVIYLNGYKEINQVIEHVRGLL